MPSRKPTRVTDCLLPMIPVTRTVPASISSRAITFRRVIFSFRIRAERIITKAGETYSSTTATAMDMEFTARK